MVPIISLGNFLYLRWTLVIWPSKFGTFAGILIEKIFTFGIFESHLSLEAQAVKWIAFLR
jgi:hypothetical protein